MTGLVNQELLLRNEYLVAEKRVLRAPLSSRLRLSDPERSTLAEIAKRLRRKALRDIACVAKPDTILGWYRRLVAQKFDGSRQRAYPGRPRVSPDVEALVVRLARKNRGWGYDRIVGALANVGHPVSDQTVGNILRRHNLAPAPERSRNDDLEGSSGPRRVKKLVVDSLMPDTAFDVDGIPGEPINFRGCRHCREALPQTRTEGGTSH